VRALAISKKKKVQLVEGYSELLGKSQAVFLTQYQGISVNELHVLRKKLREANSRYTVAKNTLVRKSLNDAGIDGVDDLLRDPTGMVFCFGDPPPTAKILVEFAKGSELLSIKGGVLGNKVLSAAEVENLAKLPPLEVIRAQLLGVISAPATQLAGVLASGVRQIINVINAYAEKDKAEGDAE
jgi:large subunit ribosomal protein L10